MPRIAQLDGLRALAILMVFVAHAFHVPFPWTGVDLFFVLSGYLITGILLRHKEQRPIARFFLPFYLRRTRRIRSKGSAGLSAALSALVLFLLLTLRPGFRPAANSVVFNSLGYSLSAIAFGGALLYALFLQQGMVHAVLTSRAARYPGRISYTFYLYHIAILQQTSLHLKWPWIRGIASFALTFGVAAISWHLLERPILEGWRWNWPTCSSPALEGCTGTELQSQVL